MFRSAIGLMVMVALCGAASAQAAPVTPFLTKPNIIVIQTDDQRWDSLPSMPTLQQELVAKGVTFPNAFVSAPLCTPSRAGMFAGGFYPQNTGVLGNKFPNGGAKAFDDRKDIGVLLQQAGYKTGMIGKYLNNYTDITPTIPAGWNTFVTTFKHNKTWTSYTSTVGSSGTVPGVGIQSQVTAQYIIDYERPYILNFISQNATQPFFLMINTIAPHYPAPPAAADVALFPAYLYRGRAYAEADVTDKPLWVQHTAAKNNTPVLIAKADDTHRNMLRSLQSVDRLLADVINSLTVQGLLNNTIIFYTSDHGLLWGEHDLEDKGAPYLEDLRVPMIVRAPGVASRVENRFVVSNLDIPTTFLAMAGVTVASDGKDIQPIINNTTTAKLRKQLYVESYGQSYGQYGLWAALTDGNFQYVEYPNGAREYYRLNTDPFQMTNIYNTLTPANQQLLASQLAQYKGTAINNYFPPGSLQGKVGQPYSLQLSAWGGKPPYTWSLYQGTMPLGLTLDPVTGLISGTPVQAENRLVSVKLVSTSVATYTGKPQAFVQKLRIVINP